MTIKLYDEDAYATNFEANVVSCTQINDIYDVILEKTLFFPEEGGQTCDQGTLNDIEVIDVQIKDNVIHHYVSKPLENKVKGCIDFKHRYNNMQNHSGEHILSGIIHSMYGYDNVGFHLSDEDVTADFNGFLNDEQLKDIENKVNIAILENHTIHCSYPSNIKEIEYRSKKEIDGAIRLVEIEGVDKCACCAPHVHSTSEVGIFKIIKAMKHKKGIRLFFVCGYRAYLNYVNKFDNAYLTSNLLATPIDDTHTYVKRLYDENNTLKQTISTLKKQSIDTILKDYKQQDKIIIFEKDLDANIQRYYLNGIKPYANEMAAVFVEIENGYRFLLTSNTDARVYLTKLKEHLTVKGGGKQDMVQGSIIATKEEIEEVLQ